jgi:branched-chain amino acid transport system permease protein
MTLPVARGQNQWAALWESAWQQSGLLITVALVILMEVAAYAQGINAFSVLISGLALGSVYAVVALGYTMVYGIIELINFAHGDVFAVGAFVSLTVMETMDRDMATTNAQYNGGQHTVQLLGASVHVDMLVIAIWTILFSMVIAAVVSAVLGVVIERVAYRPLRNAPRLAPLITAIGVSFIIENSLQQWRGGSNINYPSVVPLHFLNAFGAQFRNVDLIAIGAALVLMLLLDRFVNQTRLGKAMRAVAQDSEAASMMGINVDRIIAVTFIVGSGLAGAGAVVYGMQQGSIGSTMGFSLGLFAFTAAVLGGIGNIRGAMLGGLLIGLIQQFVNNLGNGSGTQWADSGEGLMSDAIIEARHSLSRAIDPLTSSARRLTARREYKLALIGLVLILAIAFPYIQSQPHQIGNAVTAEVYVLLALGLNIVVGYAGLLDLGYAAFFAIGALTMAWLASPHFTVSGHSLSSPLLSFGSQGIYVNFFLMIPIAAITAASCGVLFGAPTLRLRGDYLAIVTLGFGEIVPQVMQNLGPGNTFGLPDITGGVNAIVGIESPPDIQLANAHISFGSQTLRPWYYLGLIIIVFSIIVIRSLRDSRLGRAWAAIREDEVAAAHMGINIMRTRLLAFALGAAFSGFGGLLEASFLGSVNYTSFSFSVSITILIMVILGGIGSIPGVILGAIIMSYLNLAWIVDISDRINSIGASLQSAPGPIGALGTWMHNLNLQTATPLIFGILLLAMMLLRPQGLWPSRTRAEELQPKTSAILAEENVELYTARTE